MNTHIHHLMLKAFLSASTSLCQAAIFVSPDGSDKASGTIEAPVASIRKALDLSIQKNDPSIILHDGLYFFTEPLTLTPSYSGTQDTPRTITAANPGKVTFSAGQFVKVNWQAYRDGIYQTTIPADIDLEEGCDGLFIEGQTPRMARFPNYDKTARWLKGSSSEAFSPARIQIWDNPTGGFLHAMHPAHWGGNHWTITGKISPTECSLEGGWMNNRGGGIHPRDRYVENIFEELDAPGEWYLDKKSRILYFKASGKFQAGQGTVIFSKHESCLMFKGDDDKPVKHIQLDGISFRHTSRTFMKTKEPLLRSDWKIYRGGAVYLERAENISITNCEFTQLGGNAYFASGYNRNHRISGCHFHEIGAGAINFVGDTGAVHNPMYVPYGKPIAFDQINKRDKGPVSPEYPANCIAEDSLIHDIGLVEKQVSGLQISVAHKITGRHLSIYDVPRAGINISENAFGGHLIEHCDVFDTVQESADHGSFNSWGRDRYWHTNYALVSQQVDQYPELPLIDMLDRNTIRNSRWRCDYGWDIDLDDGSSGYLIENNLCLGGGIKLREGYHRIVRNNLVVANTFHPHVWFKKSEDQIYNNIWATPYEPIQNTGKGKLWDKNMHLTKEGLERAHSYGVDAHGSTITLEVENPDQLDFSIKNQMVSEKLAFTPFDLTRFGVQKSSLKAIARTPQPALPRSHTSTPAPALKLAGATIKNIETMGEVSVTGLPDKQGVLLTDVSTASPLAASGLKNNDVIRAVEGTIVSNCSEFLYAWAQAKTDQNVSITLWRSQKAQPHTLPPFPGQALLAKGAKIEGNQATFDPNKQYIGRWLGPTTVLSWNTRLKQGKTYTAIVDQAHVEGFSNTYSITGMQKAQLMPVCKTGGWESFQLVQSPASLEALDQDVHNIKLVPGSMRHGRNDALMNFKALFLIEK